VTLRALMKGVTLWVTSRRSQHRVVPLCACSRREKTRQNWGMTTPNGVVSLQMENKDKKGKLKEKDDDDDDDRVTTATGDDRVTTATGDDLINLRD
ncbi:hypothetical protein CR513_31359, partial [Mucuna pruriens]